MPSFVRIGSPQAAETSQDAKYDTVAQAFHWGIVVLLVAQYATKLVPVSAGSAATEAGLNAWHLAVGPTILLLMLLRLAWRLTHRPPPPPDDLTLGVQWLLRGTHWLFYGLLIVLPVLGWLAASGFGAKATLAGIVPLPALMGKNRSAAEAIGTAHGALAWLLLAVIVLHVSGAMYHVLVKRDGVLGRMLPGSRSAAARS